MYQAARNVCEQRQIAPANVSWRNAKYKWNFSAPAASQGTLHCVLNWYSTVIALSSVKVWSRSSLASVTKNPVGYDMYIRCVYIGILRLFFDSWSQEPLVSAPNSVLVVSVWCPWEPVRPVSKIRRVHGLAGSLQTVEMQVWSAYRWKRRRARSRGKISWCAVSSYSTACGIETGTLKAYFISTGFLNEICTEIYQSIWLPATAWFQLTLSLAITV